MNATLALSDYFFQKQKTRRATVVPARTPTDGDAQLVARAKAGDLAAYETLITRHRDRVLNLAMQLLHSRHDAEDVAQEAFANAYFGLENFRGDAAFSTWIYRIAFNLCVHRKRRARPSEEFDEVRHGGHGTDGTLTKIMVQETLAQLSEPLRAALVLREIHDLSYEEVAAILQIPVGTVRSRLNEARRQFRALWSEE